MQIQSKRVNFSLLTLALTLAISPAGWAQQSKGQAKSTSKPAATSQTKATSTPAKSTSVVPVNSTLESIIGNQPDTFTAKQVIEQNGQAVSDGITVMRKGKMQRIEMDQFGTPIVIIARPDKQKAYTMRLDKKQYVESANFAAIEARLDPFHLSETRELAPRNIKIEDLGNTNLAGQRCRKYRISFDQANNIKMITIWRALDLQGLIIRQENEFMNMKSSFELQNVNFEVAADLFDLPKDFEKVENNRELFKIEKAQN